MAKSISLCFLSASLLAAPFLFPVLFPLAWFAFVPLFWVIRESESLRHALFCGWLMGFFAHLLGFHWLAYTIRVFGGFSYPVSGVVFLIYAALQGIQIALLALSVRRCGLGPLYLFPALFWVVLEFWFPLLFPWYLANSQSRVGSFIQTADLVGPYGASFIIMWFNAALYALSFPNGRERTMRWMPMAYVVLFVAASLTYGFQRLAAVGEEMAAARKLEVAAVQGNVDVDLKWNPALVKQNLQTYLELTKQAENVSLVIWPESTIEDWLPDNLLVLPANFMPELKAPRAYFIFGARSYSGKPGTVNFRAFNSAFLTDGKGRVLGRYHKQVLLAFGEYLPFSKILSLLPAMPFADGFTAGEGPRVFHVLRRVQLAPLICYEDLMPHLTRAFVKQAKANVLVAVTNDAWYGNSVALWQHAWLAQWRAIETRRSLLRVTNTGLTTLTNAKGEIVESLPVSTPAVMKTQIEVLDGETLYVRYGDFFAWGATFIAISLILALLRGAARFGASHPDSLRR